MSAIGSRINTLLLVLCFVTLLALVALSATRAFGGPLDPPSAPAPTDGVRDAGTPISSLPFTINAPGRYYVTRDLTAVVGQNGVTISASDVTLDLNGFTLHGVAQSADGVLVSGARTGVNVLNGRVRGWFNGIDAQTATFSLISHVDALGNGQGSTDGSFGMIIGADSVLENCNVSNNKATGIRGAVVTIRNCRVSANGNDGIYAANGVRLDHNEVRLNSVAGSGWFDVRLIGVNFASENFIRYIGVDRTSSPSANIIVRNAFCFADAVGALANGDTFPISSANPEFNGREC